MEAIGGGRKQSPESPVEVRWQMAPGLVPVGKGHCSEVGWAYPGCLLWGGTRGLAWRVGCTGDDRRGQAGWFPACSLERLRLCCVLTAVEETREETGVCGGGCCSALPRERAPPGRVPLCTYRGRRWGPACRVAEAGNYEGCRRPAGDPAELVLSPLPV